MLYIEKGFKQSNLIKLYKNSDDINGLCQGIVMEYARHYFVNKLRNQEYDFIKKLNDKLKYPSHTFMDRVLSYQQEYELLSTSDKDLYKLNTDIAKMLNSHSFDNNEISFVLINPSKAPDHGHVFAIQKDSTFHIPFYRIFDPNYGESVIYRNKNDLLKGLTAINKIYKDLYQCEDISAVVLNALTILKQIGIIDASKVSLTKSKYCYKIFDAIKSGDLSTVFELNKYAKLIHNATDDTALHMAARYLREPYLIKIIKDNKSLNVANEVDDIVYILIAEESLTPNVIDALVTKLHDQGGSPEYGKAYTLLASLRNILSDSMDNISCTTKDGEIESITIKSGGSVIEDFLNRTMNKINDFKEFLQKLYGLDEIELSTMSKKNYDNLEILETSSQQELVDSFQNSCENI